MPAMQPVEASTDTQAPERTAELRETAEEARHEAWKHWPVNWTAVWVGALSAFSLVLLFGLVSIALGAHHPGLDQRVVDLKKIGLETLVVCVNGAFFSFAAGGWIAGKIAGILHAEPGMLNGAIVWLLAIPMLVGSVGLGASNLMGGWYGGMGSFVNSSSVQATPFVPPDGLSSDPSAEEVAAYRALRDEYHKNVNQWREDTPKATRNAALVAVAALLLGLIGSVLGGWMASGEPMSLTHHCTRKPRYYPA